MDDLKTQLRDLADEWFEMCDDIHVPLRKAADRIEALDAEVARLRESGKIAALLLECATGAALWLAEPGTTLAEIRQALKGPTDGQG